MEFAPNATERVVTDPYFGGEAGFEAVLDQCEAACSGLLAALRPQLMD
jgi:protein-tyrosine phosphatase